VHGDLKVSLRFSKPSGRVHSLDNSPTIHLWNKQSMQLVVIGGKAVIPHSPCACVSLQQMWCLWLIVLDATWFTGDHAESALALQDACHAL